jgi:thioredoxin 1
MRSPTQLVRAPEVGMQALRFERADGGTEGHCSTVYKYSFQIIPCQVFPRKRCSNARTERCEDSRMADVPDYTPEALALESTGAIAGPAVLDFGTNWCGHCRAAGPVVLQALERHVAVRHLKVEDGPGRRLGRQFGVKLWPTLVFLRDGQEVCRLVRPVRAAEVAQALERIDPRG